MEIGNQTNTPLGRGSVTDIQRASDGTILYRVLGVWWDGSFLTGLRWACYFDGMCAHLGGSAIKCNGCDYWMQDMTRVCDHVGHACSKPTHDCHHRNPHTTERLCAVKTCGGVRCHCVPWKPAPAPPPPQGPAICEYWQTCVLSAQCGRATPHPYSAACCDQGRLCEIIRTYRRCIPAPAEKLWVPARIRYDDGPGLACEIQYDDTARWRAPGGSR